MKVQVPKENSYDDSSKLNDARMSEFIVDIKTGDFVTEWDAYKKLPDGTYDFNPDHYTIQELQVIANTESFNYGPSKGNNKKLKEPFDGSHDRLDVKQPADPDIRIKAKDEWDSENSFNAKDNPGDYADIVKKGEKDVEAWNKVPEEDKQKVYNNFVKYCNNRRNSDNPGFAEYCKERGIYGYE